MENMKKIGVIGCGTWGRNIVRNFYNLGALNTVCDLNENNIKTVNELYPEVYTTSNFNEILENEPNNIDALNGKGSALIKLNNFDDAEKCFDKSLTISENTSALINKGIILKNKKDYQNAIYYFNKAIEMDFEMNTILSIFKNEIFKQIDINSLHKSFNKKAMI